MPINNITQTISTIPEAAHRGVDVQTVFVIKQEDFQDHLQGITVTELNTLKDQLNSRIGEINSTTTTMNGYANTASAGASTATTKAGEASTSASEALASRNQASTFATKSGQWADNDFNVEVETGKYSAKHWATVAQSSITENTKGANIASATTTTIGTAGLGDYIHITGTTTITSFGTATNAGLRRILIFDGALTIINGANLICVGNANIVTTANTIVAVIAETTTQWRVEYVIHPSVSFAELGYLDGVTSNIQNQINNKFTTASATESVQGLIELATTAETQAGTDDTRAITPLKLKNSVIGLGQTWQDVTASRVAEATYTNSTGKPIEVSIAWSCGGIASHTSPLLEINGINILHKTEDSTSYAGNTVIAIVPPSNTYKFTLYPPQTKVHWKELR